MSEGTTNLTRGFMNSPLGGHWLSKVIYCRVEIVKSLRHRIQDEQGQEINIYEMYLYTAVHTQHTHTHSAPKRESKANSRRQIRLAPPSKWESVRNTHELPRAPAPINTSSITFSTSPLHPPTVAPSLPWQPVGGVAGHDRPPIPLRSIRPVPPPPLSRHIAVTALEMCRILIHYAKRTERKEANKIINKYRAGSTYFAPINGRRHCASFKFQSTVKSSNWS